MIDFKSEIATQISKITDINKIEIEQYIEIPPNKELGDYAFPCFKLAKTLKKAPQIIANEIMNKLEKNNYIENFEVTGGYLNFYINKYELIKSVLNDIETYREKYGSSDIGQGKNVVIDYSSPNIAKPFHIGHLRSTVIGGALYKIYNFLGYNAIGINYLGDWGIQFGKVMAGYSMWKNEYNFEKKEDELNSILKIYVRFNKEEKENPDLTNKAKEWFKKLESGDNEATKLWEWMRKTSLENYEKSEAKRS